LLQHQLPQLAFGAQGLDRFDAFDGVDLVRLITTTRLKARMS